MPRVYCQRPAFSDNAGKALHDEPRPATATFNALVHGVELTIPLCDECKLRTMRHALDPNTKPKAEA